MPEAPEFRWNDLWITLAVLAAALAFLAWGGHKAQLAVASAAWPTAEGVVTANHTERSHGDRPSSHTVFRYRYRVHDVEFTGSNYRSTGGSPDDGVRKDDPIVVRYDPERPERSLVQPGLDWTNYLQLGLGGLFALAALQGLVRLAHRAWRSRGAASPGGN
ncbi:MAG: DUF3592 domain-containing protein [Planctomycetes bacterium]|nr:DUF3592 domain-containing protein [Planctomycetota bacterium]